ncbi:hypothetical protein BKCO1_460006 [Neofusicoccum parvum]|nr:hypothetical protein BKCO1_460006 [Neofusicoccum parvum]
MKDALFHNEGGDEALERPDGIKHYLTLSEDESPTSIPTLVSRPLAQLPEVATSKRLETHLARSSNSSMAQIRATSVAEPIKHEGDRARYISQTPSGLKDLDPRAFVGICSAYDTILRHFYGMPIRVDTVSVQHSIFQAEILVSVFRVYGCLPAIRPHLGNLFSQYRQKLFEAIAEDPSRWLNLSIPLESASFYTEAFIHLLGSLPSVLRSDTRPDLSPTVLSRLKRKHEQLKQMQGDVIGELFRLTIHVDDKPVKMSESLETWLTVQLFHDWLAVELDKIERPHTGSRGRPSGSRPSFSRSVSLLGIGTLMRRIHRGGDSYLPYDKVLKEVKEAHEYLNSDWDDLADDLRSLKKFASRAVENICRNNLMLDPDTHKIPYLTCVDVGMKELPWAAGVEGI